MKLTELVEIIGEEAASKLVRRLDGATLALPGFLDMRRHAKLIEIRVGYNSGRSVKKLAKKHFL